MSPTPNGIIRPYGDADALVIRRDFPAPIQDVWSTFAQSDRLALWIGYFTGDPADGHVDFTMNAEGEENQTPERAEILDCTAPHRLEVRTTDGSGSWQLIADLTEADGVTTVEFSHVIGDPAAVPDTGPGWEYYLDRLGAVLAGTDPGAVDWDDYYPAQRDYYSALAGDPPQQAN